jgi:hypothetical protein
VVADIAMRPQLTGGIEGAAFLRFIMRVQVLVALAVAVVTVAEVPCESPAKKQREQLKPPEGREVLRVQGEGEQIYRCQAKRGSPVEFEWTFRAEAKLVDHRGNQIGKHYFDRNGTPTWELLDGSRVTAKPVRKIPAPKPADVPWLLLKAQAHQGQGKLAKVTYIQRVDTQGGVAPAAKPTKTNEGKTVRVKYKAAYVFFGAE